MLFEFILIQFFKTCLFVKTSFYLLQTPLFFIFQMPVFFTFLNTKIGGGLAMKQLPRESSDLPACPWLLRLQICCLGKFLSFYGLKNFTLTWIRCGSEESYDDLCLWDI